MTSDQRPPDGAAFEGAARASRRAPVAIVAAAVGFLAVAFVVSQAPTDRAPEATGGSARPPVAVTTSSPAPSSRPTVVPAPTPLPEPPPRNDISAPRPTHPIVPVPAGRRPLFIDRESPLLVSITIPDGWSAWVNAVAKTGAGTSSGGSISVWKVQDLYVHPCRWATRSVVDPALLTTAADQAEAMGTSWGEHPGQPANPTAPLRPIATSPRQTTLAGRDAWYLEVLIRRGFDFSACDADQIVFWYGNNDFRVAFEPGELHRLWVVEAPGGPIVIDATLTADASAGGIAEYQAVLETLVIEPGR